MKSPISYDAGKNKVEIFQSHLSAQQNNPKTFQNVVAKQGFLFGGSIIPSTSIPYAKNKLTHSKTKSQSAMTLDQGKADVEKDDVSSYSINWAHLMTQNIKK